MNDNVLVFLHKSRNGITKVFPEFSYKALLQDERILGTLGQIFGQICLPFFLVFRHIIRFSDTTTNTIETGSRITIEKRTVHVIMLLQGFIIVLQAFHHVEALVHHRQDTRLKILVGTLPLLFQFRIFRNGPSHQCRSGIQIIVQEFTLVFLRKAFILKEQLIVFLIDFFFIDTSEDCILVADTVTAVQKKQRCQ